MAERTSTRVLTQVLVATLAWVEDRPKWLRPPLYGALFIYAFMALRGAWLFVPIGLAILAVTKPLTAWHLLLAILIYAPLGGFVGGMLYTFANPLTRHLGRVGTLLQCLLAGFGYGVVLVFLIGPTIDDKPWPSLSDPAEWVTAGLIGLIGGLAIGVPMMRKDPP
jgi:hypothetical protein